VVAERALEVEESGAAAHLLVAAHEALKLDPQRIEALQRAWAIIPDDLDVGLTLAIRLGEAGRGSERRAMLAELLERFAQERRYAGLEEAALEFVEHEEHDGLVRLVHTLPLLVEQGAGADLSQLLGIAFPALAQAGHAGDVLDAVRKMVTRTLEKLGPVAAERFRPMLVESLRQGPGRLLPEPTPVFEIRRSRCSKRWSVSTRSRRCLRAARCTTARSARVGSRPTTPKPCGSTSPARRTTACRSSQRAARSRRCPTTT